jgi:hypothetical protein
VQRAIASFLLDPIGAEVDPTHLVAYASQAIRAAYQHHGILEIARRDPARRFGATLALAAERVDDWRFVLIGDSGIRLNGTEHWLNENELDLITASLRREAYRMVAAAGGGPADQARVGRTCAFHGAAKLHPDMRPWLDDDDVATLRARCLEACLARFPAVPVTDVERLLDGGVVTGQGQFQNNTLSPLSYAVLDGFEVPMELVRVIDRPRAAVHTVELFTDGYFEPAGAPSVDAWEAAFREVERVDPEKVERYPCVKGSAPGRFADDRTVLVVRLP